MPVRQPIAFMSYVRSDDEHDGGQISIFRRRLEGEVKMQTGRPFAIFQDRNDIAWGQNWEDRINGSLAEVTFLIPVITPSFFQSPPCRSEFKSFLLRENNLGLNRLILPLYYVSCDEFDSQFDEGKDEIAEVLRKRNWTDWRDHRFKSPSDGSVGAALADMGKMIKDTIRELQSIQVTVSKKLEPVMVPGAEISIAVPEVAPPKSDKNEGPEKVDEASLDDYYVDLFVEAPAKPSATIGHLLRDAESYHVYTRKFDEVVIAGDLVKQAELLKLYNYLAHYSNKLNNKFKDRVSDLLAKIGASSKISASRAITILVDNSGSMRGPKIAETAAWCLLIAGWLEQIGIAVEVLGYTTRAWKGGQSREAWLASGKPWNPGRLNDLRHVIYKPFSASTTESAPNLAAMLSESLLKENIDGEALLWAASRLRRQVAKRKMLVVLSDGAPVDDSTLAVNPGNFLEVHLRRVIKILSDEFSLYAVGIRHDVSRYYLHSDAALDTEDIGLRVLRGIALDTPSG